VVRPTRPSAMRPARRGLEGPGRAAGEAFITDGKYSNALGKLSRHEAALMNAFTKTLQMLHFMQSQRPVDDPIIDALAIPSNGLGADGLIEA
jgi:hypothetical protein